MTSTRLKKQKKKWAEKTLILKTTESNQYTLKAFNSVTSQDIGKLPIRVKIVFRTCFRISAENYEKV